jgi:hypothetical protein
MSHGQSVVLLIEVGVIAGVQLLTWLGLRR